MRNQVMVDRKGAGMMATDKQETRIVTPMGDRALGVNQLSMTKSIATGETSMNKNNDRDNDTG